MFWNASFLNDTGKPAGYIIQPAGFSAIDGQKFPSIAGQDETAITIWLLTSAIVYFNVFSYNGIPTLKAFNFNNVYDIRRNFNIGGNVLVEYLVTWQSKITNVAAMYYFYRKKAYKPLTVVVVMQIILFLMSGRKEILFYVFIILLSSFLIQTKKFYSVFLKGIICALILAAVCYFFNISSWPGALIIDRALYLPAQLNYQYYDFFSTNGFAYLSYSIFKPFFSTKVFSIHPILLIGEEYYNNNWPNAGYLADAYMNFGFIGMIVFSVLLALVILIIDFLSTSDSKKTFSASMMPIFAVNLYNGALLTCLLTGGLLFFICILVLYEEEGNGKIEKIK